MSRIRIEHTTIYRYVEPVTFGQHRLVLRPREGHDVQIEKQNLVISPAAVVSWHRDIFGNSIALASFSASAEALEIRNEVILSRREHIQTTRPPNTPAAPAPMSYAVIECPVASGYLASVYESDTVSLAEWFRMEFNASTSHDVTDLVGEINAWIYKNIAYRRREDRGVQTPMETLALKSGSCRDMATLMLETTRAAGVASRFVSGYLDSQASAAGIAATHAWIEVYYPEYGWCGYDPTLGELTSHKHIVTGVSSHPRGVMPISGAYGGNPESYLGMTVSVKIERLDGANADFEDEMSPTVSTHEHVDVVSQTSIAREDSLDPLIRHQPKQSDANVEGLSQPDPIQEGRNDRENIDHG
jgi:transglutaminase-like putative cysteine protease